MSFSADFSVSQTFTRDRAQGNLLLGAQIGGGITIVTDLGISLQITTDNLGRCQAVLSTSLAELWVNIFGGTRVYGGCPYTSLYDTGGTSVDDAAPDGGVGHRFIEGIDYGPCASYTNTVSGTFRCYIRAAEYKQVNPQLNVGGPGEPINVRTMAAYAFSEWEWGYSLTLNTPVPNFEGFSPLLPMSGSFGIGERYTYDNHGIPTGVVYDTGDGMGGARYAKPEAGAYLSANGGYSDAGNRGSASITNANFASGPWSPLPYIGQGQKASHSFPVSVGSGTLTVADGGMAVYAASSTPAHIVGRVYRGDALYPGKLSLQIGYYTPGAGLYGNNTKNFQYLDIVDGKIDTYLPQIRSQYDGHAYQGYTGNDYLRYVPALPADRDDYQPQYMTLMPDGEYTNQIKMLDDYVWSPFTLHCAQQTQVEDFADVSGWTARSGMVASGPGLKLTATGSDFRAQSPNNFSAGRSSSTAHPLAAWDARNYRYLQMTVDSSTDGGPLKLTVVNAGRAFQTQALKAGSNTLVIDLCGPIGFAGLGLTRTGWDTQPDGRYGILGVQVLQIEGVAVGQSVTIHDLTLIRKESNAPGYVYPEQTATDSIAEAYWYPPDVPFEGYTCGQGERPDDVFQSLTYANHTYARIVRTYADGKPAGDLPHAIGNFSWYYPNSAQLYDYIQAGERLMLSDFVNMVNKQTGLSCTTVQDGVPSAGYPAAQSPAVYLTLDDYYHAAGLPDTLDAPGLSAPPVANLDGAALLCRYQFDAMKNYPGQFRALDYAFSKRLHWTYEGLVVTPDGSSAEGSVVTLAPCSDFLHEGPLTTKADKNGYFRFPFVGNSLCTLAATGYDGWQVLGHERSVGWIGLTGKPPAYGGQPSYDVSETGRHIRAYVGNADAFVVIGTSDGPVPVTLSWVDVETRIGDTWPVVRWERRARQPRLFLVSKSGDSGDINLRYSLDEGRTWTLSAFDSSTASTTGTLVCTEHGLLYIYYRTTLGAIKGQILDSGLNVVQAEFTAVASGVDDTGISAKDYAVGGGRWIMGLQYVSGGRMVYKSGVDGMNFA